MFKFINLLTLLGVSYTIWRLRKMPTLSDLTTAVANVKTEVNAAADRVLQGGGGGGGNPEIPQPIIDDLNATADAAKAIAPAAPTVPSDVPGPRLVHE